jgi:plasmid stabilization system protein ParE
VTDVRWSPQSVLDLDGIHAYIAEDSSAYADLTVQRIIHAVERRREFPTLGRIVPERREPDLREVILGPFRVVYRHHEAAVEIVTVFRASRQFPHTAP